MELVSPQVLDQYMRFRGETNRSLAAKAGIGRGIIGHLRSGLRTTCSPKTARAIAEGLQAPLDLLFVAKVTSDHLGTRHRSHAA